MKRAILGFSLFTLTVNAMENTPHYTSVIPLAIKEEYQEKEGTMERWKKSFVTSKVIITFNALKKGVKIKYERCSFTVPNEHEAVKEIAKVIRYHNCESLVLDAPPSNKIIFTERYEDKGVIYFRKYFNACAVCFDSIYKAIDHYLRSERLKI